MVPTVYQGNYSPVARKQDTALFPVLRKHNVAFYAYSPLAGGFLTKSRAQIEAVPSARWDATNPSVRSTTPCTTSRPTSTLCPSGRAISTESGIPKAELAYRWVAHNSPLKTENGDAYHLRRELAGAGSSGLSRASSGAHFPMGWPSRSTRSGS